MPDRTDLLVTETVSSATALPVSLEEMKEHLRIPLGETHENDYLEAIIMTAADRVEQESGRKLLRQVHTAYYDRWSTDGAIVLPYPPLQTVSSTTGVVYTDSTKGSNLYVASSSGWVLDSKSEPGRVCLSYNASWPTDTLFNVNPIAITFTCGYSTVSTGIPRPLRVAVKMIGANLYENREEVVATVGLVQGVVLPRGVSSILAPYRIWDWAF